MSDLGTAVRAICLSLPEVTERLSQHEFPHLWCAAPAGARAVLVASSETFLRPPYVGGRGWVGVRLDGAIAWDEIADTLEDAYRAIAPARLLSRLDEEHSP